MENLPTILGTLFMLILLQAVLGFDNLLYISLESKRAPERDQSRVRKLGIGIAMALRIILLFLLISMIEKFQSTWFSPSWKGVVEGEFNLHAIIVLLGGAFIIYTATKEIFHMIAVDDFEKDGEKREPASSKNVITKIVVMNLVFSFDSILSAIALTSKGSEQMPGALWIMMTRNRMYEVLGLFILFVVGILLVSEGGELAKLKLGGHEIHAMSKATFYFVISVLVLTEIVQSRYKKKLLQQKKARVTS